MTLKAAKQSTPANVTLLVAALTFLFQGLPPIFEASEVINDHTAKVVAFICDISNMIVATAAIFFGVKK